MYKRLLTLSFTVALLVTAAILVWGEQSPVSAQSPRDSNNPTWGADLRINPLEPVARANAQVNRILTLAVDPTNPNNVVAGYDTTTNEGLNSAFSSSSDGGISWTGGRIAPVGTQHMIPQGNGGVAYDAAGTSYFVTMGITSTESGFFVLTGTNGVLSPAVPIVVSTFDDYRSQANLSVDPRPQAQNVYAFWLYTNNIKPYYHGISSRYSHDKGKSWSGDTQVSDPGNEISQGPSSVVASDGTVYVASTQLITYSLETSPRLYIDRSTDAGVTWGTDNLIGGSPVTKIGIPDYKGHELTMPASADCSLIRVNHYPYIAVAPNDPNTVYAVWNDGRWDQSFTQCTGTGKHSDIAFSRSTDRGVTWSNPIRINDDPIGNGIDQFFPGIGVRADGVIGVTWYDRRYDPTHPYWHDLAYSQSTDGGITWSPNVRVSDQSSNPDSLADFKGIDDVGARKNVAFGPNYVLPAFIRSDPVDRVGDFYTDRGLLPPVLTATPTSIATGTSIVTQTAATQTSTPVATATSCTLSFTDVNQSNTFYLNIRCLACRGIISGYADGTFRPGNEITRGQIAKIVSNAAGYQDDPGPRIFEDVDLANTFYTWINRLSNRGFMSGYACGTIPEEPCNAPDNRPYFRPFANATRGQLAKIVANTAGVTGTPTGQFYADVAETQPFYLWIMRLTNTGVMSGYPCGGPGEPCDDQQRPYFRPFNNVTRGQASKIVANTFLPNCQTPSKR